MDTQPDIQVSESPRADNRTQNPSDLYQTTSTSTPNTSALQGGIVRELSKKVYTFLEIHKLTGLENYNQWKQAHIIMFRALGLPLFVETPEIVK